MIPMHFSAPSRSSASSERGARDLDGGNERNPFDDRLEDNVAGHTQGDGAAGALTRGGEPRPAWQGQTGSCHVERPE